jgi:hypothetical protein
VQIKHLQKAGLLSTFTEYSTFAVAVFVTFSFFSEGMAHTIVTYILEGSLHALFDPAFFADHDKAGMMVLLGAIFLILIYGYCASIFHPFSKRVVHPVEARAMMLFAGACTLFVALTTWISHLKIIDSTAPITFGTILATFYLITTFVTFRLLSEKDIGGGLWSEHQLGIKTSLAILFLVVAAGVVGFSQDWQEHITYQIALTLVFILTAFVQFISPKKES